MLLIVAILLLCTVPAVQADTTTNPLHAQLDGPMVVTAGSIHVYVLTMVGGPAEMGDGNYSYTAELTGENTYGASILPGTVTPKASGTFYLNLTAPAVPQTLTITIKCTSASTTTTVNTALEYNVRVVEPVVLSATITNTGKVSVNGVPLVLQIFRDGDWVQFHSTTLDLGAGETYDLKYNWTALDLRSGEYKVRMLLDPDNSVVTFEGGSAVYETTIYYDMPGYGGVNSLLWVLVIALGFVTFLIWRRPAAKGKGKKRR